MPTPQHASHTKQQASPAPSAFMRRIGFVSLAAVMALGLAACAAPESVPPSPNPAAAEATPEPAEPKAGEAAISAAHVCGQVTTLSTMEGNAVQGVALGVITPAEYAETIDDVKDGFHHVLVDDSDVGKAVTAASNYLKSAERTAAGESYNPKTGEWTNLRSAIAQACRAAGSDLTGLSLFGG
ncbi:MULTISPECIES: hypothetical protein [unclassified Salinibacterium]|uniref:hypothetical protein n=1 Tax=unclassified Salinibacterium TaxID=2632331 RepID=UPI001420E884|nr:MULTISPECIES: hypothetical protein [unclassified Salinibacterium]